MSDNDVPAGQAGGPTTVSASPELPARLRVHALAKLISTTSRQVLDTLTELGAPAKGVQSSIDRDTALRVIEALAPPGGDAEAAAHSESTVPTVSAESTGFTVSGESSGSSAAEQVTATERPERPAVETPAWGVKAAFSAHPWAHTPTAHTSAPGAAGGSARNSAQSQDSEEDAAGALPLFAAPSPMFLPPEPAARPAPVAPSTASTPPSAVVERSEDGDGEDTDGADEAGGADDDSDESADTKRRRRRGRRGRGRGKGSDDESSDGEDREDGEDGATTGSDGASQTPDGEQQDQDEETDDSADDADGGSDEGSGSSRRRRRRRRRKDSDGEGRAATGSDDPPNTVTKVREPRPKSDGEDSANQGNQGIQGVRGSTRLEAKRQRRRDGRDAGRRRTPVLSEAEFLARRESVDRTMVVRQRGERSEIGVLEDGVLVEHFVTSSGGSSLVGNVYLGRVQNVLPSMEAAFVDIGRGRNAVLYAGEVDWDAAGLAGKARRIEQALSSGDSILVQVTKDPIGHKGARLTTQISLPGRFLVYVPSGGTHGISRKLPDTERRRLKDLLKEIVPDDAGVIIRTASEGVSQEALERDVRRLQAQWDVVRTRADSATSSAKGSGKSKAPELLYEEPDLMIKVVRDQFNEDFAKLVVEGDDAWDTLHAYVGHVAPELTPRLHRHVGTSDVFSEFRIDEQLTKALDRKAWLPSGGTLVIDRTEAMTVVDVNTGKFTGSGGNLEETVTRNNLEAAEEIVRQLRLRDIGGIIVIDFIDMVLESNRDLVLRRLTECLGRDRTRHQVAEVTSLGLVQMTRKRVGVGLLDAFSTPCEHCRGRGVVVSSDPVEPRGDGGQHGSGGGRRRGRGGDHGDGGSGGGNGGNNGGGANNGGNGNGGGNNGRRRGEGGNGGGNDGRDRNAGQGGPPAPNGKPAPAPATPTPATPAPATPAPATPAAAGTAPDSSGTTSRPAQLTPSSDPQPARQPGPTAAPAAAQATPAAAQATPAAAQATPAAAQAGVPAGAHSAEPPARDTRSPAPSAGSPGRSAEPAAPAAVAPTATEPEAGAGQSAPEPVGVGAQARPARRRRRAASRPAGPPAVGD